jgi:type IV pilus assembly protein PilA
MSILLTHPKQEYSLTVRKLTMKKQSGFTLIELMIVVAIVAILAAVAMPAYKGYVARAKFSDVINSASAVKSQVELCYSENNALDDCDNGGHGINWRIGATDAYASANIDTITVANGKITAVASGATGIDGVD